MFIINSIFDEIVKCMIFSSLVQGSMFSSQPHSGQKIIAFLHQNIGTGTYSRKLICEISYSMRMSKST